MWLYLLKIIFFKYFKYNKKIKTLIIVSTYAQVVDLGTNCGLGTSSVNKITSGTNALKGNWHAYISS